MSRPAPPNDRTARESPPRLSGFCASCAGQHSTISSARKRKRVSRANLMSSRRFFEICAIERRAVELRGELRFRHGEAQLLHPIVPVAGVGRDAARIDKRVFPELLVLHESQRAQRPLVDVFLAARQLVRYSPGDSCSSKTKRTFSASRAARRASARNAARAASPGSRRIRPSCARVMKIGQPSFACCGRARPRSGPFHVQESDRRFFAIELRVPRGHETTRPSVRQQLHRSRARKRAACRSVFRARSFAAPSAARKSWNRRKNKRRRSGAGFGRGGTAREWKRRPALERSLALLVFRQHRGCRRWHACDRTRSARGRRDLTGRWLKIARRNLFCPTKKPPDGFDQRVRSERFMQRADHIRDFHAIALEFAPESRDVNDRNFRRRRISHQIAANRVAPHIREDEIQQDQIR